MTNIAYDPLYSAAKGSAEGTVKGIFDGMVELLKYFEERRKEPLVYPAAAFFVSPLDKKSNWSGKSLPFGVWYYNPVAQIQAGGSLDLFQNLLARLATQAETVKILSVTGFPWGLSNGLVYDALARTRKSASKRFLVVNPNDAKGQAILSEREIAGGVTRGSYIGEINIALDRAKQLKATGHDIDVRFYADYPFWRLFIFDSKLVFAQTYPKNSRGDITPVLGFHNFDREQYSLAEYFVHVFDTMFDHAVKAGLS